MTGMKIGYARVSTNDQDLTAQRHALLALGVEAAQICAFRDPSGNMIRINQG